MNIHEGKSEFWFKQVCCISNQRYTGSCQPWLFADSKNKKTKILSAGYYVAPVYKRHKKSIP